MFVAMDHRLNGKLFFSSNVVVPERIRKLFNYVIFGVGEQLEKEGILDNTPFKVNCIFTEYGKITLELDEAQFGNVMGLIIYPIQKWLNSNLSDLQIMVCIAEELCHYFWAIENEVEVNYKVLEVIRNVLPDKNIQMHDIYNVQWMEEQN